jgi:hypothetical protein
MIDYAYLTTLSSLARVRKNARQWDFFCWLLSQADEKGYAEVSVNEYALSHGIAESTVRHWLISRNFRELIEAISHKQRTIVYFCKYESYVNSEIVSSRISRETFANLSRNSRECSQDLKEKFPPAPPIKENYVKGKDASLKQQQQAAGATFVPTEPFEVRRARFIDRCREVQRHHPEYTDEAVKSFIMFWTEIMQDGIHMKFEVQSSWGTGYRMKWYIKRGHWLDAMQQAKLEAVTARGGNKAKTPTTAEIKRKEAELEAEKQEHERRARERIQQAMNSRSHEEAMLDPQYWLAMDVNNPDTLYRAQRDPRHLEAYKKAVEIAKRKENK